MVDGETEAVDKLSNKDRVLIILEEYKTLRAEILQKTTIINSLYVAAGTALLTIVGVSVVSGSLLAGLILIPLLLILIIGASLLFHHDLVKISIHLKALERDINLRADGDPLLMWETKSGLDTMGFAARARLIADRTLERAKSLLHRTKNDS